MNRFLAYMAIVSSLLLSACANEVLNTFASSVSASACRSYFDIVGLDDDQELFFDKKRDAKMKFPEWTTFEMNISDGTADCVINNAEVNCAIESVDVDVSKSSRVVKVIVSYNIGRAEMCKCYKTVFFTLEDLPEDNFRFEVFSKYNRVVACDTGLTIETLSSPKPNLSTVIHRDDPENIDMVFPYKMYPY